METLGIWVAGLSTLALFSFLYKDNPFYRMAEHIFAGLSAGYYFGLIYQAVILQQLVDPIGQHWQMLDAGTGDTTYHTMKIIFLLFAGLLGVMMFSRFFPKLSWISRFPLAFIMGNTAGIYLMSQLHGLVLPQMAATFVNLASPLGIVIFFGVVATLIYFYFSKEHKGVLGVGAKVGIWFIMVSFGAHFGYTVMARISLLIGQLQFILIDWLKIV
ncbi:MAG: hypothetical protein KAT58_10680 [candidate division Zixibacteria bacterium]|nr:hypothetical protein [candidate division Zixibacteria bacterium]